MDAKERAEEFFASLILQDSSEIRQGCVYLIAKVIHEGMEYQKAKDAEISRKWGNNAIAQAIESQTTDIPQPSSLLAKALFFFKKKFP